MPNYVQVPEGDIVTTLICDSNGCNNTFTIIGKVGYAYGLCIDCWIKKEIALRKIYQKETGEI